MPSVVVHGRKPELCSVCSENPGPAVVWIQVMDMVTFKGNTFAEETRIWQGGNYNDGLKTIRGNAVDVSLANTVAGLCELHKIQLGWMIREGLASADAACVPLKHDGP
jgi:hypothetical protein